MVKIMICENSSASLAWQFSVRKPDLTSYRQYLRKRERGKKRDRERKKKERNSPNNTIFIIPNPSL